LGRLVLDFLHTETNTTVSMFFNVQIKSKRTGKKYPAGRGGQFTCAGNCKLRRFWMDVFGKPPSRPSRAHHELHKLKDLNLKGEAIFKKKNDGTGCYWELTNLWEIP
jgi:hypothetical protein